MSTPATCPYCFEDLRPGDERCRHCGERLTSAPATVGLVEARARYELGEMVGWAFKDPEWWQKVLVGAACLLGACFFVPMLAELGYKLRIARQQRRRPGSVPMPSREGFGDLVSDGFRLWAALLLVALSILGLVVLCGAAIAAAELLTGGTGVFAAVGGIALYMALIFGSLAFQYVLPAIELEFLETGSVLSGVRLPALWRRITSRPGDYLVLFVYYVVANFLASAGMFLCYVGMFLTIPWGMYTQGCVLGRYLAVQDREGPREGLAPTPEA